MTPLRAKYIRDLVIHGRSKHTQEAYIRYVCDLARANRKPRPHWRGLLAAPVGVASDSPLNRHYAAWAVPCVSSSISPLFWRISLARVTSSGVPVTVTRNSPACNRDWYLSA